MNTQTNFHNPENVPSSKLGDGYRFLYKSECGAVPPGTEFNIGPRGGDVKWEPRIERAIGSSVESDITYRVPLPKATEPAVEPNIETLYKNHNPGNVESPGNGFRFLVESELAKPMPDLECFSWSLGMWEPSGNYPEKAPSPGLTYRTKAPYPAPEGYRQLANSETMEKGDLKIWNYGSVMVIDGLAGELVSDWHCDDKEPVFRKLRTEVSTPPSATGFTTHYTEDGSIPKVPKTPEQKQILNLTKRLKKARARRDKLAEENERLKSEKKHLTESLFSNSEQEYAKGWNDARLSVICLLEARGLHKSENVVRGEVSIAD
jgi:hypothetical protein